MFHNQFLKTILIPMTNLTFSRLEWNRTISLTITSHALIHYKPKLNRYITLLGSTPPAYVLDVPKLLTQMAESVNFTKFERVFDTLYFGLISIPLQCIVISLERHLSCGGWNRATDFLVMGQTSYHC